MKVTKAQLKQIIKEEIGRVLNEENRKVSFELEGTETSVEFLGMETKHDQTEVKLRINGVEHVIIGAYDIDSLADGVIGKIEDDDKYWFLGDYPDEPIASNFKTELEKALKAIGAGPQGEEGTRTSYRDRDTGGTY